MLQGKSLLTHCLPADTTALVPNGFEVKPDRPCAARCMGCLMPPASLPMVPLLACWGCRGGGQLLHKHCVLLCGVGSECRVQPACNVLAGLSQWLSSRGGLFRVSAFSPQLHLQPARPGFVHVTVQGTAIGIRRQPPLKGHELGSLSEVGSATHGC